MGFGARSFNPGDVLPPTVPVVTATRTGPQEITVTWGASSDASGVARYYIREYGVPSSEVEVIGPNRSRVYSGLAANTAFRYEVRAQDIYGNISLYGSSALVSTLPINVAPVWSVIPALALPYSTGGTRDVKPYVADANGDPITISLVNPPAGYTISNGVINATASVAAATLTLSATDGLLTATTTMTVTVASSATQIRWHPGHGLKAYDDVGKTDALTISDRTVLYSYLNTSPLITFVFLGNRWGRANPTGSTFTWSVIDAMLDALPTGKRAILSFDYKAFAGGVTTYLCPADLAAANLYVIAGSQSMVAVWRPAVMDRFIAYIQAAGAKYNADSRVEGITWAETASGAFAALAADYSRSALATQLKRLYTAAAAAFPNTNVFADMNSLTGELGGASGLLEYAYQAGIGLAGPDAKPETANTMFTGVTSAGEVPVRDYRGLMPCHMIGSSPSLTEEGSPAGVIDWCQSHGVTHIPWYPTHSTWNWSTVLAAVAADPTLFTSCPASYAGTCDGG